MALDIVEIGHPVLRETAAELSIEQIQDAVTQQFIDDLIQTRAEANGAGIAANQVNNTWRIFVVEVNSNPRYPYKPAYPLTVMINPKITHLTEDRYNSFEGCLSIPNLRGVVKRCPHIQVDGFNRLGEAVSFEVAGISAGTFQHELDHLNGVLFPDKVFDPTTFCTWNEFKARYEEGFKAVVMDVEARYNSVK